MGQDDKRRWMFSVFTVLAAISLVRGEETCTGKPIAVPIQNVTLTHGGAVSWGASLKLGTPPQQFAMSFATGVNATVFRTGPPTEKSCSLKTNTEGKCNHNEGGLFYIAKSSTWEEYSSSDWTFVETNELSPGIPIDAYGRDKAELGDVQVDKIEFGIAQRSGGRILGSKMGLAPNATIVNTLKDNGDIPVRMFGLDMGSTGQVAREGQLVLGGYNKKKVKGDFYSQKVSSSRQMAGGDCPYIVLVTDMSIEKDGKEVQLIEKRGDVIRACLDPNLDTMTLPSFIVEKFNQENDGAYSRRNEVIGPLYHGYRVANEDVYQGDLKIYLASGFVATIPSHILHQPTYSFNQFGDLGFRNTSEQIMTMNALEGSFERDTPILGLPFMRSIYFMVDMEEGEFSLADLSTEAGDDFVSPGCDTKEKEVPIKDAPASDEAESGTNSGEKEERKKEGPNAGMIGGAVGAAVVVVTAVIIGLCCAKKRKRGKGADFVGVELPGGSAATELGAKEYYAGSSDPNQQVSEAAAHAVYEAPDSSGRVYHEMDTGSAQALHGRA